MNQAIIRSFRHSIIALSLCALAGCFDEPEPAYESVPAGARVYLSDRGLGDLSGEVFDAGKVDYLNLDRNALTNVDVVATLTGLKWLRLNDNRLERLPDLRPLVNLRRIYLKNNRLKAVPESLKDLPALTDVDLSGNTDITEVPAWFAAKKGLENVSLTRTRIRKLPENLDGWKTLSSLQLGDLSLSSEEMARIRKALPRVAIVF